ncbi:hypothetical protein [Candidatus Rhodobacter oscarellae]|uniref:hypothetical protein n=1 Tax=Candidatus Rhodobacter oscarellae TaxID=1675527 RepID=UPI00128EB541|nr:hypothetical protein [Candidatus Rhodobacter lobularis]
MIEEHHDARVTTSPPREGQRSWDQAVKATDEHKLRPATVDFARVIKSTVLILWGRTPFNTDFF